MLVSGHFQKKEEADKVASDCMERMCQVEKEDIQTKTSDLRNCMT